MNTMPISAALRMDHYYILRYPAFNRVPLDASTTTTSKPLVFPSQGQHIQASAEEKMDKLLTTPTKVPRNTWKLVRPLGPKQETIQPSKPTMSQSTYYRRIWAFRQECLSKQAPPTRTRRQPEDNTLPTLFVNTGPLLGR
ncbi:hypothetical protein DPEC_G00247580 [Dallia pectoralis]|uniref:Uncharacterized protein n=1 Tax=Dallia pectoralis TaxID=75939 RepID=A0ACC2FWI8_DALPE|nr:hypothetical protein DPEC_G00247580 [Dallia pectoralis]